MRPGAGSEFGPQKGEITNQARPPPSKQRLPPQEFLNLKNGNKIEAALPRRRTQSPDSRRVLHSPAKAASAADLPPTVFSLSGLGYLQRQLIMRTPSPHPCW